ncbi:crossover junction endonuclease EME1 [Aplochiton taeniatus]
MGSYSDSTSDLDEDLPIYDFRQAGRGSSQVSQSHTRQPELVVLDSSDTEVASSFSPASTAKYRVEGNLVAVARMADIMLISSSEDEDVPHVPLAQRLKQKQQGLNRGPTVSDGRETQEHTDPSSPMCASQTSSCKAETLLSSYQLKTVDREPVVDAPEAEVLPQLWPPLNSSSWAGSSETSPAKRRPFKRMVEDMRRKEARERQQGGKEVRRLEQDRQKVERKALADAVKALRPEECIKHMVVGVDPALLQVEGGGALLTSVHALGCSCAIEKQSVPQSVSWIRRSTCRQSGDVMCVPEAHVVMLVTMEDFITLVHSYTKEQQGRGADGYPSLTSWVLGLQARNPSKTLNMVLIDLEQYFRSQKFRTQKKYREAIIGEERAAGKGAVRKRKNKDGSDALPEVSRVEVEEAGVHLQLHTGVQIRFLSSWKEFSDHIVMTTKAIAEAPFKRQRDTTGFSFYLETEWAGGQRVDKAGKGLLQVWKRQIQQLNRVSPDMASAILAAYPSPQLLKQAYRRCKTEREKNCLLSELLIRRGEGVTATTRRVGPEFSKRLCLLMTLSDPEQTLDSTV